MKRAQPQRARREAWRVRQVLHRVALGAERALGVGPGGLVGWQPGRIDSGGRVENQEQAQDGSEHQDPGRSKSVPARLAGGDDAA
jgi:hypothetical protein